MRNAIDEKNNNLFDRNNQASVLDLPWWMHFFGSAVVLKIERCCKHEGSGLHTTHSGNNLLEERKLTLFLIRSWWFRFHCLIIGAG